MTPPIALTIAGSDCSSGAGIQADLKTFSYHGCHGLTALTCVVAETPEIVESIHPVPPAVLQEQVKILLDSYPVDAIKTGMLYSKAHLVAVVEMLSNKTHIPLVVDPVMVATSGSTLVDKNAIQTYRDRLLPLATLITPNMPEASVLLDQPVETLADLEPAAKKLSELYHTSVLLKGGHLPGNDDRLDILWHKGTAHHFSASKIDIACTHGTGCTLSAAITAHLANGANMIDAVSTSIDWVHSAILNSFKWKSPSGNTIHCLNHLRKGSL
ncbi:MAG: bifunctional hydroxymethylpyrimidine kinase/phosphomethylpyrimidine kinase [Akkermansiaceae bacterium]